MYPFFPPTNNCVTKERRSFPARRCYSWHRYRSISVLCPNCWSVASEFTGIQTV